MPPGVIVARSRSTSATIAARLITVRSTRAPVRLIASR